MLLFLFYKFIFHYHKIWLIALGLSLCNHLQSYSFFKFSGRWLSFLTLQLQCDWFASGMVFDASWSFNSLSWRPFCDKWDSLHYDIICWSINCQKSFKTFVTVYFKKLIFWIWNKFAILTLFSQSCCKLFCNIFLCSIIRDSLKYFSFVTGPYMWILDFQIV